MLSSYKETTNTQVQPHKQTHTYTNILSTYMFAVINTYITLCMVADRASGGGFILVHIQNILLFIPCTVGSNGEDSANPPLRSDRMKTAKMKHHRRD